METSLINFSFQDLSTTL